MFVFYLFEMHGFLKLARTTQFYLNTNKSVMFVKCIYITKPSARKPTFLQAQTCLRSATPSDDSDQPAHSRSLIRNFSGRISESQESKFVDADIEDSDQTARMRRLI